MGRVQLTLQRIPTVNNPSIRTTDLPTDFKVYISDNNQQPDEKSASWTFSRFKTASLEPAVLTKGLSNAFGGKNNAFNQLYFKFESSFGCKFKMEVNFPDEDNMQRRKNEMLQQGASVSGLRSKNQIQIELDQQVNELMTDPQKCKSFLAGMTFLKRQKYLARSKDGIDYVAQNAGLVAL